MERFYLEHPSAERKDGIIEYLKEFVEAHSEIHGSGGLDKAVKGMTFEEALANCLNMQDKEYAEKRGYCPGKTFLLMREDNDSIVGTINVRWDLNENMLLYSGHIGYAVRPFERRKGYGKIILYLGLKEARRAGLDRVMISCAESNPASERTILALGGVLERCCYDPEDDENIKVYWIDVEDSLDRYGKVYEPSVRV